ncbi:MAG: 16S rRNA processing protein RimM [Clostridiales bacterium]|nr:16S rRNA processing protein RimM [Clostridiales bacterium]
MKSEFEIAKVVKPRGLKGEMKVEFYSSDVARLSKLKHVKLRDTQYEVEKLTPEGQYGFVKLKGIDSIEAAEAMRGQLIFARREDLPSLSEDKFYIVDIIGLSVIVDGGVVGTISDVLQYGSADVYVVKSAQGSFSFPALKQVIKEIDVKGGKMVLDDVMFSRVVVYN